jgi:aminoglycoside 3-N-acetyltransferase
MINEIKIKTQIKNLLKDDAEAVLLIHSDLLQGFKIPFLNRNDFLISHYNELNDLHDNLNIWMPTFNYDFLKNGTFDIQKSKSQVGVLSEYFRGNISEWRSSMPVFSFSGFGKIKSFEFEDTILDPFGDNSDFSVLYKNRAWLMHYGSLFSSSTILHYAERISGKLVYRYDKFFTGSVIDMNNLISKVTINYHVRPKNNFLEYDWVKIENDLIKEGILYKFENNNTKLSICRIDVLIDFWLLKLNNDPYYLLDQKSKSWVITALNKFGRPFLISDFE